MKWNQLNTLISKRWLLLLRYYLPFFKKPEPFYFTLRQFIDKKLNTEEAKVWNLSLFSEFLTIINDSSISDGFREKLILCVLPADINFFDYKNLSEIFKRYKPSETNVALNVILNKLPPATFEVYLKHLYADLVVEYLSAPSFLSDYKNQIAWCAKLKDKFRMEDRLRILTLLPDKIIEENRESIHAFTMDKIEEVLPCIRELKPELQKKVLKFYLQKLEKENPLYLEFLTEYFALDPQNAFSTLALSGEEQLQWSSAVIKKIKDNFSRYFKVLIDFFTYNLQEACSILELSNKERLAIITKMYNDVPTEEKERWLALWVSDHRKIVLQTSFISHLITCAFSEKSEIISLMLNRMLKSYQLSPFQILAIQSLLNIPPLPREQASLEKKFSRVFPILNLNTLEPLDKQELPPAIQNRVIGYGIKFLYPMVQEIINKLPLRPEKNSLHSYWSKFVNKRWIDSSVSKYDQWKIIENKIIKDYGAVISDMEKAILFAYGNLYALLDPQEASAKEMAEYRDNDQRTKEENSAAVIRENSAELIKNLSSGMVTSVPEEYMVELYGEEAEKMKSLFFKRYRTTFFTVKNDAERIKALSNAVSTISFLKSN